MGRALIVLLLVLAAGEITGLLDTALAAECASTCSAGEAGEAGEAGDGGAGCALCPCCHQGRLLGVGAGVSLVALTGVVRLVVPPAASPPGPARAGIFHPPKAVGV